MSEKVKNYVIIGLAVLLIILGIALASKSNKIQVQEQNIAALNDTLALVKMANGDLLASKKSLVLKLNELEEYTSIQEKEVKRIQKELGEKVKYISQIEGSIQIDTIVARSDSIMVSKDSSIYDYYFSSSDQYYNIVGFTRVLQPSNISNTFITNTNIPLKLNVGLTENWTIFVKTDNPYVTFSGIEGANLDKKAYTKEKSHFSIGLQLGVGPTVHYGINFMDGGATTYGWSAGVGCYLGVGVQYNFIVF